MGAARDNSEGVQPVVRNRGNVTAVLGLLAALVLAGVTAYLLWQPRPLNCDRISPTPVVWCAVATLGVGLISFIAFGRSSLREVWVNLIVGATVLAIAAVAFMAFAAWAGQNPCADFLPVP